MLIARKSTTQKDLEACMTRDLGKGVDPDTRSMTILKRVLDTGEADRVTIEKYNLWIWGCEATA